MSPKANAQRAVVFVPELWAIVLIAGGLISSPLWRWSAPMMPARLPSREAVLDSNSAGAQSQDRQDREARNQQEMEAPDDVDADASKGAEHHRRQSERQQPGEIPEGSWTGDGEVIFEQWAPKKPAATDAQDQPIDAAAPDADPADDAQSRQSPDDSIYRRYRTTLDIRSEQLEGHEIYLVEIRSRRGSLPDLEDETHLLVALEEAKRLSRSTVLYRAIAFQMNPKPDDQLIVDPASPLYSATCTSQKGETTLTISYMENFSDVFRFEKKGLEKVGTYFKRDGLMVHWNERLTER